MLDYYRGRPRLSQPRREKLYGGLGGRLGPVTGDYGGDYGGYGGGYDGGYGGGVPGTYTRFALPGWMLVILGFVLLVLGLLDVGWTATKYPDPCEVVPNVFYDPCAADHIYTWVAAPIWGGLLILLTGFVALMMTPRRLLYNTGWLYYLYVGMTLFVAVVVAPAIVVLNALEIAMNDGTFYSSLGPAGGLAAFDQTKFAVPIVIAVFGGIAFFVAIVAVLIGCFWRPEDDMLVEEQPYVKEVVMERPVERPYVREVRRPRQVVVERPREVMVERPREVVVERPREVVVERKRPCVTRVIEEVVEQPRYYDDYDDDEVSVYRDDDDYYSRSRRYVY